MNLKPLYHCLLIGFVSVPCSLVVTCLGRADLLTVVCVLFSCVLLLTQMCPVHIRFKGVVGFVILV